jgi:hypothetical protein
VERHAAALSPRYSIIDHTGKPGLSDGHDCRKTAGGGKKEKNILDAPVRA